MIIYSRKELVRNEWVFLVSHCCSWPLCVSLLTPLVVSKLYGESVKIIKSLILLFFLWGRGVGIDDKQLKGFHSLFASLSRPWKFGTCSVLEVSRSSGSIQLHKEPTRKKRNDKKSVHLVLKQNFRPRKLFPAGVKFACSETPLTWNDNNIVQAKKLFIN